MSDNIVNRETEETESMEEDVWDDTLLVKAYDKAISLTKEKIASRKSTINDSGDSVKTDTKLKEEPLTPEDNSASKKTTKRWKVGGACRSVYACDGLEYEAYIKNIDYDNGVVLVKYIGYNNEEEIDIMSIKPSKGKEAQSTQKMQARLYDSASTLQYTQPAIQDDYSGYQQSVGVIPPPPPPFVMSNLPKDENDALSAMLMSWYMSGFHTGYYQGLLRAKTPSQSQYRHNN